METLKKFYAVTASSSLYEAVIDGEGKIPRLTKKESIGGSKVDAGTVFFMSIPSS